MTFKEYSDKCASFLIPTCDNLDYAYCGLLGEVAEFDEKITGRAISGLMQFGRNAKMIRAGLLPAENIPLHSEKKEIAKELGDILFFLDLNAKMIGYTLEQIAQMNNDKLSDRQSRNIIIGEGDNR